MAAPTKSTFITNLEAAKHVVARPGTIGGRLRIKQATQHTIPFTSSAVSDVHRMLRFNSGDIIHRIQLYSNGGATAGDADLGLYLADDGAVIDADLFVSAWALDTATTDTTISNQMFESGQVAAATEYGDPLWSIVGRGVGAGATVSAGGDDPIEQYDLAFTMTVAATVADTIIGVEVLYTAGD